jgi:hypothetical protein
LKISSFKATFRPGCSFSTHTMSVRDTRPQKFPDLALFKELRRSLSSGLSTYSYLPFFFVNPSPGKPK